MSPMNLLPEKLVTISVINESTNVIAIFPVTFAEPGEAK